MASENVAPINAKRTAAQAYAEVMQDTIDGARAYVLDAMTMCQTLGLAANSVANTASCSGVSGEILEQINALNRMATLIYSRLDPVAADLDLKVAS